ncbi:DUF4020 domain-containing protein [Marinicrinis lubricantis]
MQWMEEREYLKALFSTEKQLNEIGTILAAWFAEIVVGVYDEAGLSIIHRNGQALHNALWFCIAQKLAFSDALPENSVLTKWVCVLLASVPQGAKHSTYLEYLLEKCGQPSYYITALLLFEYLCRPYIQLQHHFSINPDSQTKTDVQIVLTGDEYYLREIWKKVIRPYLNRFASALESILTSFLQQMYHVLAGSGQANETWDPISYSRSAIEPHEQDRVKNETDFIIDAARELIEYFCASEPAKGLSVIQKWASADSQLLKRLAIHGLIELNILSPDQKIDWMLEKNCLNFLPLKHEVFRLLKLTYPSASESVRTKLLDSIEGGPETGDEEANQYEIYNLLGWLKEADPSCPFVNQLLSRILEKHPDFEPREHRDLNSWMTIGSGHSKDKSSISAKELLAQEPEEILEWLLTYQDKRWGFLSREGLLAEVSEAVSSSFDWGKKLIDLLKSGQYWTTGLWKSILRGWEKTNLNENQWEFILDLLLHKDIYLLRNQMADLLLSGIEKQKFGIPMNLLPTAETVSYQLWDELDRKPNVERDFTNTEDWLTKAINHPGGKIVQFWLHSLSKHNSGSKETAIPESYRLYFTKTVNGDSISAQLGRVILASHLHYLFFLDSLWTQENIIPLLKWSNEMDARQAWDGYLSWGEWNEALLADLVPMFEKSFEHISQLHARMKDRFCEFLASIAVYSLTNPINSGWLLRFIAVTNVEIRRKWAMAMRRQLHNLKNDGKREVWGNWLKNYWEKRTFGIPLPLHISETEEMASWVIELEPVFDEVTIMVCRSPVPALAHTSLFYRLSEDKFAEKYPVATLELLFHLLSGAKEPFYHCEQLAQILKTLINQDVGREKLRQLSHCLIGLGCVNLPQT